jgi:hypothetical protein
VTCERLAPKTDWDVVRSHAAEVGSLDIADRRRSERRTADDQVDQQAAGQGA